MKKQITIYSGIDKNGKKNPIDIKNPSDTITYSAVYDKFVAQEGGEYPELVPRFEAQVFDFDLNEIKQKEIC